MKYIDGTEIKVGDKVEGKDWRGYPVQGTVIKGDPKKGQRPFIFQHAKYGTVCPGLNLSGFKPITPAPAQPAYAIKEPAATTVAAKASA